MHPRLADALALLSGALLVLAFAPFEVRVLAVVAPMLLFLLWLDAAPGTAARLGYLFGLGMFGLGVSWIFNSLHFFGAAIAPLAALITLLFVMFLSLYPALLGVLLTRWRHRPAVFLLLIAPSGWVLWEWLRGWFLTGFPWLYLGHTQVDTWLGGVAPLLGVLGVSWLVALIAGLLVLALRVSGPARWVGAGAALLLWLLSGALSQLEWTRPSGEPLRATLIQGSIAQVDKWNPQQFDATLELYRRLTREHWDSDLIVWPETAVPTFYFEVHQDYLLPLREEAEANDTDLLIGIFGYDFETRAIYNSILSWGATPGMYHKRHLVPFGEYIPLRGLLGWLDGLIEIPMSDLSSGSGRPLLTAAGQPVGLSICYEDAFGEEMIDALPEATLLVNVSNDAWFGVTQAPHQHLEIARMRARETGRYLLRATNTGISAVIGPRGEVVAVSPQSETEPAVLTAVVQPRSGTPWYGLWGNGGPVSLLLIALSIGIWISRRERPAT
jgi:apolipoprotein N-acyltransferase